MKERSLSDLAAKVLADDARTITAPSEEARAQAIDAIARAMRQAKRRRARVRWMAGASLAAAAAVAIVVGFRARPSTPLAAQPRSANAPAAASFVRGAPAIVRAGERKTLTEGAALEPGDRVIMEPGSRTTVALANGTYVLAGEHTELLLASAAPATTFELGAGAVHADVAKLSPGERFIIRTDDAEVEVRGTSFDVTRVDANPTCAGGNRTRVTVREGIVAVRAAGRETLVHAGESWPKGCATSSPVPPGPAGTGAAETATLATTAPPLAAGSYARPAPKGEHASDLAAQNDLFEKALARKRAGDAKAAIAGFEELLARHPSGHLSQAARAERMKLLRGVDPARARAAATDYLKRHPEGFARGDAELILSGQ